MAAIGAQTDGADRVHTDERPGGTRAAGIGHEPREGAQGPGAEERFAAAAELASTDARAFKRSARRFSLCAADAEDAYQRSLEILLTKAPTSDRSQLRAWLHTVVKHEALAVRRQRERTLGPGGEPPDSPDVVGALAPGPDEQAGGRERARQAAEALAQLKPSELRCMLLKALGYSYREISEQTGFSWTKVNRSLTEGRRRFLATYGEISSGERCEQFQPLLSAASDGEATRDEELRLRTHLSACASCRASLRGYRAAPARLAELLPPLAMLPLLERGWWPRLLDWAGTAAERAGAAGAKLQQSVEALSAHKTAAVVASTAALAGGAAVHQQAAYDPVREQVKSGHGALAEARGEAQSPAVTAPPAAAVPPAGGSTGGQGGGASDGGTDPAPAGEFTPEARAEPPAAGASPARASSEGVSEPGAEAPAPSATPAGSGTGERAATAAGEFGP